MTEPPTSGGAVLLRRDKRAARAVRAVKAIAAQLDRLDAEGKRVIAVEWLRQVIK